MQELVDSERLVVWRIKREMLFAFLLVRHYQYGQKMSMTVSWDTKKSLTPPLRAYILYVVCLVQGNISKEILILWFRARARFGNLDEFWRLTNIAESDIPWGSVHLTALWSWQKHSVLITASSSLSLPHNSCSHFSIFPAFDRKVACTVPSITLYVCLNYANNLIA